VPRLPDTAMRVSSGAPAVPWRSRADHLTIRWQHLVRRGADGRRDAGGVRLWDGRARSGPEAGRIDEAAAARPPPDHAHPLGPHSGFPFFAPLFARGNEWDIYAPGGLGQQLEVTLAGQRVHVLPDHTRPVRRGDPISRSDRGPLRDRHAARHRAVPQPSGARPRLPTRDRGCRRRVRGGSRASRS
jgi:hypothetical protein